MYFPLKISSKINNYEVIFIDSLEIIIDEIKKPNTITFIDFNVAKLYPKLYEELNLSNLVLVKANEESKTLDYSAKIFSKLFELKANTKTRLIVIGGGILQDICGFCASTYCRGIEYILVPTTLLAQADSCIGGKTSINFQNKKNLIGTFYPPSKILIYPNFTNTLSNLDYISGLGEIYKFSIIQNKIHDFDLNKNIEDMIYDSLRYKIKILLKDEFDRGERKFLNFGHTFGHAIESISNNEIPHGIAVIIGCMIAVSISNNNGFTVNNYDTIILKGISLLNRSGMKFKKEWFDFEKLLPIIKSDKKSTGQLTMVLVDSNPFLKDIENLDIIQPILTKIYETI
jgi:3-dehydroquinate synthase